MTTKPHSASGTAKGAIMLGALGVVFGDIGTSPLYTVQTVFSPSDPHPVPVVLDNVYGVMVASAIPASTSHNAIVWFLGPQAAGPSP